MSTKYHLLCRQLYISENCHHQLKIALTHSSFKSPSLKNNSRYVFLGQTMFKGTVAKLLYDYVAGTGQQLQHTLGNFFKPKHLGYIAEHYKLLPLYTRYGKCFNATAHIPIFVYGLLGFMVEHATEKVLNKFIYKHFLLPLEHELPKNQTTKNYDYKAQLFLLCSQLGYKKPTLQVMQNSDGLYTASLTNTNTINTSAQSKSYKYVIKKVYKMALKNIVTAEDYKLQHNATYMVTLKERAAQEEANLQEEKEQQLKSYFEKRAQRSVEIKAAKAVKKEEAAKRDAQRKQSKQRAKERKELMAKQERLKSIGLENMSAAKRRILEDRGVLPKKK